MVTNMKKYYIYIYIIVIVFAFSFIFAFPTIPSNENIIVYKNEQGYIDALNEVYPEGNIILNENSSAVMNFKEGDNALVFATQGVPLEEINDNYNFTPQFLQTIVIVIDKEQTDLEINSFKDLFESDLNINFDLCEMVEDNIWEYSKTHHIIMSVAYALYGSYDISAVSKDIEKIISEERFYNNDYSQPVTITYDSVAVNLIKSGKNLEIVLPSDGTLSFEVGLLENSPNINIFSEINPLLVENGYRLINGESDKSFYPEENEYKKALLVKDYTAFNEASTQVSKIISRNSFQTSVYGFINPKESATFYFFISFILVIYLISIIRRVSNKKISNALINAVVLMILFVTLGCFKAISRDHTTLEFLLWYCYYIPIILIPMSFLYIAIFTGKSEKTKERSHFFNIFFGISLVWLAIVLTNNFHNLIFIIEDNNTENYEYTLGYFMLMAWIYACVFIALGMLMYKSFRSPQKKTFILPLLATEFALFYTISYVLQIPIVADISVSFGLTIVVLVFCEACLRSGFLPINKGYDKLFSNSKLNMEIRDLNDKVVTKASVEKVEDPNFILRKTAIAGGTFSYYEDYSSLNKTRKKLSKINDELEKNIEFLMQQGKVSAELSALAAEETAYGKIDEILKVGTEKISLLLEEMKTSPNPKKIIGRINILVCVIKRECMLLINLLYKKEQPTNRFMSWIYEMKEFCTAVDLNITAGCNITKDLPIEKSLSMYRLFSVAIENSLNQKCSNLLLQIYEKDIEIVFSITAEYPIFTEEFLEDFSFKHCGEDCKITIKPWDETEVVLLTFRKE